MTNNKPKWTSERIFKRLKNLVFIYDKEAPDYTDSEIMRHNAASDTEGEVRAQGKRFIIRTYRSGEKVRIWIDNF